MMVCWLTLHTLAASPVVKTCFERRSSSVEDPPLLFLFMAISARLRTDLGARRSRNARHDEGIGPHLALLDHVS
jgi:hypothetical protein